MRPSHLALALHPLLFAAYAVLFLYAENVQLVRASEVIAPLFWSLAGAGLLLAVAVVLARDLRRGALIASALVIGFFGFGHLAGALGREPGDWPLVAAWSAVLGAVIALLLYRSSWLPRVSGGLTVAGLVLVFFALSTVVPNLVHPPVRAVGDGFEPTGLTPQRTTERDVYLIVPDRYGSPSSLEAEYGITDNDMYDWLEERGFDVVRESYANYSRTSLSMAAVLNLDYVQELIPPQDPASRDYRPVHRLLQEHLVGRFMREQGYRYVHVGSWFNPTRSVAIADENLESDGTTEFQAVLDQTTALPLLTSVLPEEPMPPEDEKHVDHARFQFRAIHRVIDQPGPKFVLLHVLLPHDPYTFDEQGRYVPPSVRREMTVAQQFRAQLEYTNLELKRIIERLLDRPEEERPIIIVQADEGPYPARYDADQIGFDWSRATPEELEAKFGIINAFYMPPEPDQPADVPDVYPGMTSINGFRMVLERYFGLDLPSLPDRVYVSASPRTPYDLDDVTDRLPGWPDR